MASFVGEGVERIRARGPLVHNITNLVAINYSANLLIAAGASPIMSEAPEETAELAAICNALVINMGTLTGHWIAGARAAIGGARSAGRPWVFDPVGVGATAFRRETGAAILALGPPVIRGNASEIVALAGSAGGGKGVDSTLGSEAATEAATVLARSAGAVVVVTGAVDVITDGSRTLRVANGHPLLTEITASGCGLTALMGAWLAVLDDPLEAAAGACAAYGIAAELAAGRAQGPGTFLPCLLDAVRALDGSEAGQRARLG